MTNIVARLIENRGNTQYVIRNGPKGFLIIALKQHCVNALTYIESHTTGRSGGLRSACDTGYVHTYMHEGKHAYMHAYIHTYMHAHTHTNSYIRTYLHRYIQYIMIGYNTSTYITMHYITLPYTTMQDKTLQWITIATPQCMILHYNT